MGKSIARDITQEDDSADKIFEYQDEEEESSVV